MITRDAHQMQVVPGFTHGAKIYSCAIDTYTCAEAGQTSALGDSGWFPGHIIDRLGLQRQYNSLLIAPVAVGQVVACSTATKLVTYMALSAGVQHASASGGTFTAYSTQDFLTNSGFWRQTTSTSTGGLFYTEVQRDVGNSTEIGHGAVLASTATSTSAGESIVSGTTSSGIAYYAGPGAVFDLSGAKRYLRPILRFHTWSSGGSTDVNGVSHINLSAAAIFGEPGEAPASTSPSKRILVTSGCAT